MKYLLSLFLSFPLFAGTVQTQMDCLKSLAAVPTTPRFPKLYFQDLNGKEAFVLRCHMDDGKEYARFLFLSEDQQRSLKLPIYYYTHRYADGSGDSTDLPRNVIHFKHAGKDFYIQLIYADVARIVTAAQLPEVAKEIMVSVPKIQSEYVKKYETWLKSRAEELAIQLRLADEQEQNYLAPCLEKKIQEVVDVYVSAKFRKIIPAYGTIVSDSRNYQTLPAQARAKYQRPFGELEAEVLSDVVRNHVSCSGVVSEGMMKKVFEKNYEKNRAPYETLRRIFFP